VGALTPEKKIEIPGINLPGVNSRPSLAAFLHPELGSQHLNGDQVLYKRLFYCIKGF
jgi:hypothetical protein